MKLIKAAGDDAGVKTPKLRIKPDENGKLRVFLLAGNGAELFRSPPAAKRGNCQRTLERIRAALPLAQIDWKSEPSHDDRIQD